MFVVVVDLINVGFTEVVPQRGMFDFVAVFELMWYREYTQRNGGCGLTANTEKGNVIHSSETDLPNKLTLLR